MNIWLYLPYSCPCPSNMHHCHEQWSRCISLCPYFLLLLQFNVHVQRRAWPSSVWQVICVPCKRTLSSDYTVLQCPYMHWIILHLQTVYHTTLVMICHCKWINNLLISHSFINRGFTNQLWFFVINFITENNNIFSKYEKKQLQGH